VREVYVSAQGVDGPGWIFGGGLLALAAFVGGAAVAGGRPRAAAKLNELVEGSSLTGKTTQDLNQFLHAMVPGLVAQYLIQAGSVRQCGSISDAFATIAKDHGFDAYVTSRPGHFFNVVRVDDGIFEIDMSAIQFEHDWQASDPDEEVDRLLRILARDPYRAMKVRRIDEVPPWARPATPENEACYYTPTTWAKKYPERVARYMRGEIRVSDRMPELGGRPYADEMKPIDLRDVR
jgi:hypothetical protein